MGNVFMNGLKSANNIGYTENGAIKRNSTMNALLDLFAMGAAYRTRSDEDCILLFKNAFEENPTYALKCLFYLRDIRGGQGERRFFRVCTKWAAIVHPEVMKRNLIHISCYGRWDDLFNFIGTPLETQALNIVKHQLALDVQCKTPSLLGKWMPSENTSSQKTRTTAAKVRKFLGMTPKQYRKTLSVLRARINVLERLMSEGRWDEIEFDKIPSKAGLKYKNAFARHDIERMKKNPEVKSYADFAKDAETKVNAKALYPYECVAEAMKVMRGSWYGYNRGTSMDNTDRLMVNKYWDNLAQYFDEAALNGMCIVDASGSMCGSTADAPINVAISLGMYCAEKAQGPFANHFLTFSSNPTFVEVEGVDFCDKVCRMAQADWGGSTNIEAAFDLMLRTAIENHCSQDEIPQNLIVISDMEFNQCACCGPVSDSRWGWGSNINNTATLMETMEKRWNAAGYQMPCLTFWNVQARQNNIAMSVKDGVQYVSGMSPSIFKQVMENKNAFDLMYEVLDADRYAVIQ